MKRCAAVFVSFLLFIVFSQTTNAATAHCDFNADGYDDLAVGIPGEKTVPIPTPDEDDPEGAVSVIYGRAGGLSATNNQLFRGLNNFGQAVTCGDFNGDHISDLAIGAPSSNGDDPGSVTVLYGTKKWRLTQTGSQQWSQDKAGIIGDPSLSDFFGWSLAAGDFNGDGFDDLAIGIRNDLEPGSSDSTFRFRIGGVQVIYGSSTGLTAAGNQLWNPKSPGIADHPQSVSNSHFGASLVAADFGKDTASGCYDDLVIGAPNHDEENQGAVHVLYGSASGLTAAGSQFWNEDSPGIPGSSTFANFGSALAAGYFRNTNSICGNRKIADLVVGASGQAVGSTSSAGAVYTIYGTNTGLRATNSQLWTQNTTGIADTAESFDSFGSALATGRKSSRGYLVIGAYQEAFGTISAGAIHVLFTNAATGLLTATGSKFIHQNTPGVKDSNEVRDQFGFALATGDFDANKNDDIAVGAPLETLNGVSATGAVHILYDANTVSTRWFHQNSADMKEVEEIFDHFGYSLAQ